MILYIATLISHIFRFFTQIPDEDFKNIVLWFKYEHFLLLLPHNPRYQIIA